MYKYILDGKILQEMQKMSCKIAASEEIINLCLGYRKHF